MLHVAVTFDGPAPDAQLRQAGMTVDRVLPRMEVAYGRVPDRTALTLLQDVAGVRIVAIQRNGATAA